MEITEQKRNELFKRTEITARKRSNTGTPKRKELIEELAGDLKMSVDKLVIDKVNQPYGSKTVTVYAKAYDSADELKAMEPKYKIERTEGKKVEEK
jgi:ribosomal protein S24E